MKCPKCGNEYMDHLAACPVCFEKDRANGSDTNDFRYAVWGFLLPPVGLVLHKRWKDISPMKAKTVKNGAILGLWFLGALAAVVAMVLLAVNFVE